MTDDVVARLILRSRADAIETTMREAQRRLIDLGFHVEQADRVSVSFIADRRRFEEVFATKLEDRETTLLRTGQRELTRSHVAAIEPITMPAELADVAETVVLPRPPQLMP
jgi:hypothetical protein